MRVGLIAAGLCLGVGAQAAACDVPAETAFRNGFATGQTMVDMGDEFLKSYVAGYADAFMLSPSIGVSASCGDALWSCIEGRTVPQLAAILRKYLNDNPDKWHWSANVLTYNAIFSTCVLAASP